MSEQSYLNLLKELVEKSETKGFREVRDGHKRCSLFGRQLHFNLQEGFPLFTHKQVFMRGLFEELMWFLRGQTDNQFLKDRNVHIWDLWEGVVDKENPTELGDIYGKSWRDFDSIDVWDKVGFYRTGFDQIEWVLKEIKNNPESSRLIVNSWNPHVHCIKGKAALPPCHTMFQFFVEDGKLSCQLYQRSGDYIIGNPLNIASYALLTHLVAQQCDLDVGEFVWTVGDVHLYSDQLEMAKEILNRKTHKLPTIEINKAKDLYSYEWSDIKVLDYIHEPKIAIPVAK